MLPCAAACLLLHACRRLPAAACPRSPCVAVPPAAARSPATHRAPPLLTNLLSFPLSPAATSPWATAAPAWAPPPPPASFPSSEGPEPPEERGAPPPARVSARAGHETTHNTLRDGSRWGCAPAAALLPPRLPAVSAPARNAMSTGQRERECRRSGASSGSSRAQCRDAACWALQASPPRPPLCLCCCGGEGRYTAGRPSTSGERSSGSARAAPGGRQAAQPRGCLRHGRRKAGGCCCYVLGERG